jgi:ribonuclease HII
VLTLLTVAGHNTSSLEGILTTVAPECLVELDEHPWYAADPSERFPMEHDAVAIRIQANALRAECERAGARCIHYSATLIPERRLNALFEQTRNKGSVLFSATACQIDSLMTRYAASGLTIVCDRQGGREHYGQLLRLMFSDWALQVVEEKEGNCEYCLTKSSSSVRLLFLEKGETHSLPTAAASMLAKYLREALMRRFNAWWVRHLPKLSPTAGYYSDGRRFMGEIEAKCHELGIRPGSLQRSR